MMKALKYNLHEAVEKRRSKTKAVKFKLERQDENRLNYTIIILGLGSTIFGFFTYYFLPQSLLSLDYALLLDIFILILIAILLGLVVLSVNVESLLETFFVWVFLFWEKSSITTLLRKNLIAHRLRNRKTAIMFATSIAFIVFLSVSFKLVVFNLSFSFDSQTLKLINKHSNTLSRVPRAQDTRLKNSSGICRREFALRDA